MSANLPWRDVVVYFNVQSDNLEVRDLTNMSSADAFNHMDRVSKGLPIRRYDGCKTNDGFIQDAKSSGLVGEVNSALERRAERSREAIGLSL